MSFLGSADQTTAYGTTTPLRSQPTVPKAWALDLTITAGLGNQLEKRQGHIATALIPPAGFLPEKNRDTLVGVPPCSKISFYILFRLKTKRLEGETIKENKVKVRRQSVLPLFGANSSFNPQKKTVKGN